MSDRAGPSQTTDVVVVGCGAAGTAAAAELARRGRRVVGLERFAHGHDRGSSHGTERIMRVPYTDAVHVELAMASLEGWAALEQRTATPLLTRTGGIDTGAADELDALALQCRRVGAATQRLDAGEAGARFPGFRFEHDVLFSPLAATVHADRTLAALRRLAEHHGAELRARDPVERIERLPDGRVAVRHASGTTVAEVCIVTSGAWGGAGWLAEALDAPVPLPPMRVTQEQVAFFRPVGPMPSWPTFIFREHPSVYGLPTPDGLVKIGEHHTGPEVDADTRTGQLDEATWDRLVEWVARNVPGVEPEPIRSATCLYASYPGDTFLLDRAGPIVVGLGLSGHGFKFVPEIGRRLADLADGVPTADNPFGFDRPGLDVGASGHR
jgi:sarcosine oxidase